jgi:hypothetical protein
MAQSSPPVEPYEFADPAGAVVQGVVRCIVGAIAAARVGDDLEGLAARIAVGQGQLYNAINTLCDWILAQQLRQLRQSGGRPIEDIARLLMPDLNAAMGDVGIETPTINAVWARYYSHYFKPNADPDTKQKRLTRARGKAKGPQAGKKARRQKSA